MKEYYSRDSVEGSNEFSLPEEYLNSLSVGGLPPHKLELVCGCPVMLIRNVTPKEGLCNGTKMICVGFTRWVFLLSCCFCCYVVS